jgi:hypothetical protein
MPRCPKKRTPLSRSDPMSQHEVENLSYDPEPNDEYVLEHSHFEDEWKAVHDDIFIHRDHGGREPYWLPNQLFRPGYHFSFIIGNYHLLKKPFEKFSQALHRLDEREFVVVGAEKQFGRRKDEEHDRKLAYPVPITWEQYAQGRETTTFFLLVQPAEFCLHGKRRDWGIVGSNDFGIAILGSRNEAREAFRGMFIEDPEVLREQYLSQAPPDYGTRFSENYLT